MALASFGVLSVNTVHDEAEESGTALVTPRPQSMAIAAQPRLFPLFLWLALLQEERSLYYSKRCLARSAELEPQFVATHRAHLADEVGHVERDEELLDWLWPQVGPLLRFINVRLLN